LALKMVLKNVLNFNLGSEKSSKKILELVECSLLMVETLMILGENLLRFSPQSLLPKAIHELDQ
jgi:hypothetical protein